MQDAQYFASRLVSRWLDVVLPPGAGNAFVAECLDEHGCVIAGRLPTTLAQGRTAFMLGHLYLVTGQQELLGAALRVLGFMEEALRDPDGGFRFSVDPDGTGPADDASRLRRTYDQSFALLALVTLRKAAPERVSRETVESLWHFIDTRLTDRQTGGFFEDDRMAREGAQPGALRGQNPHMHMLEALLQAYEMSGDAVWLDRAAAIVSVAEKYLIDPETGAVREFVGHDLGVLDSEDGLRREPGHQFEWCWLLTRYAGFSGDDRARSMAGRMRRFGETRCIRRDGVMAGALYEAVRADGRIVEPEHLLWPLTEAGKAWSQAFIETGDEGAATNARAAADLVFSRYVDIEIPAWINRIDGAGNVTWKEGLSRLLYHIALFVTEGDRAGLWKLPRASMTDCMQL